MVLLQLYNKALSCVATTCPKRFAFQLQTQQHQQYWFHTHFSFSLSALVSMAMFIAKLNASFAAFGRASAARKYTLLFFSLTIALFLSCPTIQRLRDSLYAASITANTDNDHFWQYSSHVQPAPLDQNTVSDALIAYQIRLAATSDLQQHQQPVTQQFLTRAQAWYKAFTTTKVAIDDQYYSLVDLPTSAIMLYSPFDDSYWHQQATVPDQWETTLASIINGSTHALDPLSVFDNVTLDKHGRFVCADSIIITALLHQDNGSNLAERVWKAVVEQHTSTLSSWKMRQLNAPVQTWQYKVNHIIYIDIKRDMLMIQYSSSSRSIMIFLLKCTCFLWCIPSFSFWFLEHLARHTL